MNAEGFAEINVLRLRNVIRQRARHSPRRIPKLAVNDIERLLEFIANEQNLKASGEENETLRAARDRAFLLILADTGLHVHEACNLRCANINWESSTIIISGNEK